MRRLLILLVMSLAWSSFAHSQQSGDASHKRSLIGKKAEHARPNNEYPTKDSPLPIIIVKSKDEASAAAALEHKTDKFDNDYLGSQLSIAQSTKKQAGMAFAATCIATADTLLTALALWFLVTTYRETRRMATAAEGSLRAAQAEFIASHRPKLVVRQAQFIGFDAKDDARLIMRCAIANIGDGEGRVTDGRYHVEFSDGNRFRPIEEGDSFEAYTVTPGGEVRIELSLKMNDGAALAWANAETSINAARPYFRGYVVYVDKNEVARRAYFSRRYERCSDRRFMPTGDPDYDPAD